jgi:phenylpyruvate tautomerase PptA (4-oxalocrotonate tautomerase family)
MALVKIELAEGKDVQTLIKMRDIVMDSVVESLKLPDDDRNIRIIEYRTDLFQMKQLYEIIIEITMFSGRSKETKKKLFQMIADNLFNGLRIEKAKIFIVLNEQPMENWGIKGGIPADEIKLDFDVKI